MLFSIKFNYWISQISAPQLLYCLFRVFHAELLIFLMLRKVPHYLRPTHPPARCSAGKLLANGRVWFDETLTQIIHSNILGAKTFQPSLYSQVQRLFRQLFILMLIWTKAAQDTTSYGNWDSKKLKFTLKIYVLLVWE